MSVYYNSRIDLTQPAIVKALRKAGALVLHIREPFDLLVYHRGTLFMVDPKTPRGKNGRTTKTDSQKQLDAAGWPIHYPRSAAEALAIIRIEPTPCPKCGGAFGSQKWCSGETFKCLHESWRDGPRSRLDHLYRACQTCGFVMSEPTLDTLPAPPREAK